MAKNTPFNGPSTSGRPSGPGRGNNPSWDDEDDTPATDWPYRPNPLNEPHPQALRELIRYQELAALASVLATEQVEMITKGTYEGLLKEFHRLSVAYGTPGSPVCRGLTSHAIKEHQKAARLASDKVRASRLENFAKLLRKAQEELGEGGAADVAAAVAQALKPHETKVLAAKLRAPESSMSRHIRSRVTIEQLCAYLGLDRMALER
jgi:hypothetical protein